MGHAAVDTDILACDEACLVGTKIEHHVCNIQGITHTSGWLLHGIGTLVNGISGVNPTRRNVGNLVSKAMSLLFNMLSRFVIVFLPRNKHLLISWLPSPSAVILEPKKIKSVTVFIVSPSICHEVMGLVVMMLVFII